MIPTLGIDISKAKFQVALRSPEGKLRQKSCPNTVTGFTELGAWLTRHGVTQVHACLEATGTFGEALAAWLDDAGRAREMGEKGRMCGHSGAAGGRIGPRFA